MNKMFFLVLVLFIISCNKDLRYSKKLSKGERWEVISVSIDGNKSELNGFWYVESDVNIYEKVPTISWTQTLYQNGIPDTLDAVFQWQFNKKGKTFFLNYQQQCAECDGADLDTLDYLTNFLTGEYRVLQHKRKKMTFESENINGFNGKTVRISIECN